MRTSTRQRRSGGGWCEWRNGWRAIDAPTSANWKRVGLFAHESAMKGGERVKIPML
jgi:hypothetical protein